MLESITTGKTKKPPRIVGYGDNGVGKSTFAANAPAPVFIQTEDGLGEIDCHKFPLVEDFATFMDQLRAVYAEKHEYQTLVIDSIDWLEKLIWADVAKANNAKSIEAIPYGKGYKLAMQQWGEVLTALDYIRNERGMAIILIAHAKIERFEDPETQGYDRHTLRLHKEADATIREWADAVLFATVKFRLEKEDLGFNKTRAIAKGIGAGGGERILRTVGSPACVAKNRFGIAGDIPLVWEEFAKYLN
jgi:hypothetical protein